MGIDRRGWQGQGYGATRGWWIKAFSYGAMRPQKIRLVEGRYSRLAENEMGQRTKKHKAYRNENLRKLKPKLT